MTSLEPPVQSKPSVVSTPPRRPGRLRRALEALGVALTFVTTAVGGLIVHLDAPAPRRLVSAQVNAALAGQWEGQLKIDKIDRLRLWRGEIAGAAARVYDPGGREVIRVRGVDGRLDVVDLLRSLVSGPLRLRITSARIAEVETLLVEDETGSVTLARAFRSLAPAPPGEPPTPRTFSLRIEDLKLDHAWAHGGLAAYPKIDADLDAMQGTFALEPDGMTLQVNRAALTARALPLEGEPTATAPMQARMVIPEGKPLQAALTLDQVQVQEILARVEASINDTRLDAVVEVPRTDPLAMQGLLSAWPVKDPVFAHLEAHGDLPTLAIQAQVGVGEGQVAVHGSMNLAESVKVDATVEAAAISLRSFAPTAPAGALNARVQTSLFVGGAEPSGTFVVEVDPARLDGQRTPAVRTEGTLQGDVISGALQAKETGLAVDVGYQLGSDNGEGRPLRVIVDARSDNLASSPRLQGQIGGQARVSAEATLLLAENPRLVASRATVRAAGLRAPGGVRASSIQVDAQASGPLDKLAIQVAARGRTIQAGNVMLASFSAQASGSTSGAAVTVKAEGQGDERLDARAALDWTDGITVRRGEATVRRNGEQLEARVDRVHAGGGRLAVQGARVRGDAGRIFVDLAQDPRALKVRGRFEQLELVRLARLAGVEPAHLAGQLDGQVDVAIRGNDAAGAVALQLQQGGVGQVQGVSLQVDAKLEERKLKGAVEAHWQDGAQVRLDIQEAQPDGPSMKASSWQRATFTAQGHADGDLRRLWEMLPREVLPLPAAEGRVALDVAVRRDAGKQLPVVRLDARTVGLALRVPVDQPPQPNPPAVGPVTNATASAAPAPGPPAAATTPPPVTAGATAATKTTSATASTTRAAAAVAPGEALATATTSGPEGSAAPAAARARKVAPESATSSATPAGTGAPSDSWTRPIRQERWLTGIDGDAQIEFTGDEGKVRVQAAARDEHGALAQIDVATTLPEALRTPLLAGTVPTVDQLTRLPLQARVKVPERALADWPALLRPQGLTGALAVEASVTGTAHDPDVRVELEGQRIEMPASSLKRTPVDVHLRARYERDKYKVGVDVDLEQQRVTSVRSEGTLRLADLITGAPPTWDSDVQVDFLGLPLQSFGALLGAPTVGYLHGTIRLDGLHRDAKLNASLRLNGLQVGDVKFPHAQVDASADGKTFEVQTDLRQAGGSLQLHAKGSAAWGDRFIPELNEDAPLTVQLHSEAFRLRPLEPLLRSAVSRIDGRLDGDLTLTPNTAELAQSRLEGRLHLTEGIVEPLSLGQELHDIDIDVRVGQDGTVRLVNGQVRGLAGRVQLNGEAQFQNIKLVSAKGAVRIDERERFVLTNQGVVLGDLWGNLDLTAAPEANGTVRVSVNARRIEFELPRALSRSLQAVDPNPSVKLGHRSANGAFHLFDRALDQPPPGARPGERERPPPPPDTAAGAPPGSATPSPTPVAGAPSNTNSRPGTATTDLPPEPRRADEVRRRQQERQQQRQRRARRGPGLPPSPLLIDVKMDGTPVHVRRSGQIDIYAGGHLVIAAGGDETAIDGQVRVARGHADIQGRRFIVEQATATFDPSDEPSNPTINASARFDAPDATRIYASFVGTVESGQLNLRSDPALSQGELLSLLLFGTREGLASKKSSATADTTRAASIGGSYVTEGLNEALSDLSLDEVTTRVDTSNSANPRPEIAVALTQDVTVALSYRIGLPTPGQNPDTSMLKLEYRFRPRWSLETSLGDRGTSILDLLWSYRY